MEPDFTGVLVLCFNKINVPDLGKESPVITDVNDKERSLDVMRGERGQLGPMVLSPVWRQLWLPQFAWTLCLWSSTMMILIIPQLTEQPCCKWAFPLTRQCAKHEKFPCTLKDETGFVEETRGGELLSSSSFILIVFWHLVSTSYQNLFYPEIQYGMNDISSMAVDFLG